MIHSMTGFAVVSQEIGPRTVTIQMKSVNNRTLDVYVKFPGVAVDFEQSLRDAVKARIQRDRVDLWVEVRSPKSDVAALNLEAARKVTGAAAMRDGEFVGCTAPNSFAARRAVGQRSAAKNSGPFRIASRSASCVSAEPVSTVTSNRLPARSAGSKTMSGSKR